MHCFRVFLFLLILVIAGFPFHNVVAQQKQANIFGVSGLTPWFNHYRYYDYYESKQMGKKGFIGIGAGFFWKNMNNRISLDAAITLDAMLPFGEPEYASSGGIRENILTNNIELIYHRRAFNKLYIMAGPNWVNYHFRLRSGADSIKSYIKSDQTFGITIGAEYELSKTITASFLYRPAFISFDRKQYWHQLGVSVRFDLAIRKW